jgi:tetratricopeptide (TPR) repeat protein
MLPPMDGSGAPGAARAGRRRAAAALALVAATFLAYLPVTWAGFVWDDDDYLTENPLVTAPDGLRRIWLSLDAPSQYFPLVYTSFRLEHAVFGLDPLGYHLVNVALHALNALLVVVLLRRLAVPGAWLAAALFALHPVQVESVAWVTERKNVLSAAFFLLAGLAWLRYLEPGPRRLGAYALALGGHALALAAKTTACTFPAAQYLACWWRGERALARRLPALLPFLGLSLAMGLVTLWWERVHQGTVGARFELGLAESVLVAGRALWFYLEKLVWPSELCFSYPRFEVDPADPRQWLWPLAFALLLLALWLGRARLGRGPLASALFFVATLSPLLGFIPLFTFWYTFVADHYQYLACLGPLALFAAGAARLAGRFPVARVAVLGGLAALGALSFAQARIYESSETLWRDTIAKNPASWMAHANLGRALLRGGRAEEALAPYREAVRLRPDLAPPHAGLAQALLRLRRHDEAVAAFEAALALEPDRYSTRQNLAAALVRAGRAEEALFHYRELVRIAPHSVEAHRLLAEALERAGQPVEAALRYREALALDPAPEEAARLRAGLARVEGPADPGGAP